MRLAGWIAAALAGFALAATFVDAPVRWVDALLNAQSVERDAEPPAITAQAASVQVGHSLAARTRALEEFADRCAAAQWERAEELRDSAGRAELQGDRLYAGELDDQATTLYEEARAEAALRREEGECLDQSTYEEMPQPSPRDPKRPSSSETAETRPEPPLPADPSPRRERSPPSAKLPTEPLTSREEVKAQDDAEAGLRSRASALIARGDPCAAARLLREQGSSQRTLLLAREYRDRCRQRRR